MSDEIRRQYKFSIEESGDNLLEIDKKPEKFIRVTAGNGEIILHGENVKNKKDLLDTLHNFIASIQAGNFRIVDNSEPEKEFKKPELKTRIKNYKYPLKR